MGADVLSHPVPTSVHNIFHDKKMDQQELHTSWQRHSWTGIHTLLYALLLSKSSSSFFAMMSRSSVHLVNCLSSSRHTACILRFYPVYSGVKDFF